MAPALLALLLPLTACSKSSDENPADGLLPGEDSSVAAPSTSSTPLPAKPIDTLTEDLTTPEGTMTAYLTYLQLGEGDRVCSLFTANLLTSYGDADSCRSAIENYAQAVLPMFSGRLDVAKNVQTTVESNDGTRARGSGAVTVNDDGTTYYESFDLVNENGQWHIEGLDSQKEVGH